MRRAALWSVVAVGAALLPTGEALAANPAASPQGGAVAAPPVPGAPAPIPDGPIAGVWVGQYACAQGMTGGRLTLDDLGGGKLTGVFDFYAAPGNPGVPSGSFAVGGTYSDRAGVDLEPGAWISAPPDYSSIPFAGPMPDADGTLTLKITFQGCTAFVARRESAPADRSQPTSE